MLIALSIFVIVLIAIAMNSQHILILLLSIIVLALAVITHLINGYHCWGLQPGGPMMANLFITQSFITTTAIIMSAITAIKHGSKVEIWLLVTSLALVGICLWQYSITGWRMLTSIHFQGPENLPTFIFCLLPAIILGTRRWWLTSRFTGAGKRDSSVPQDCVRQPGDR
jgi:hypothetical protein